MKRVVGTERKRKHKQRQQHRQQLLKFVPQHWQPAVLGSGKPRFFKVLKEVRSGTGERWRARATCLRRGSSGDPQCSGILGDTPAPCHPPSCIAPHRAFCTQASRVRSGRSCALAKSAPRKKRISRPFLFFFEKIRIPRLFIRREQHCRMFTSCYS